MLKQNQCAVVNLRMTEQGYSLQSTDSTENTLHRVKNVNGHISVQYLDYLF